MKNSDFNSVSVSCGCDLSDSVSEILEEFGASSVSVLVPNDDNRTTVTALYELDELNLELLFSNLELLRRDDDQFQIKQETLHGRDWVRESQNRFKPILINDRLWIMSPWHKPDSSVTDAVTINPGLSFGTGHHPTTRMCLEFLTNHRLDDCEVVDFGCGSGILALSALRLGCRFSWGVDTDEDALDESADNADRNDMGFRFMAIHPSNLPSDICADVVLANLHLDALLELSETLKTLVYDDGWLVMSGILRSQMKQIKQEYEDAFDLDVNYEDNWVLVFGRKKTG